MGRKRLRKNYYKNSNAGKRNKMLKRFVFGLKLMVVGTALVFISLLFVFSYDFLTQCDYFKAEELMVNGTHRLTQNQVLQQANIATGVNIFSVNLSKVRKRLLAHSWIEDAEVRRDLPSGINIRVKEQEPLAVLDLGRKFIINTHGEIFKEMDKADHCNLPMISGLEFSDINVKGESRSIPFDSVMKILGLGQKPESVLPYSLIKKIHVDREMGLSIYAFDNIREIKIGYNNYQDKYAMLKDVLFYLEKNGGFSRLESIDLNNLNRIVVSPAKIESAAKDHKEV
ncbi:MAG: cell division protein FtsQ/DivIB [Desulfobacterales bacterium]